MKKSLKKSLTLICILAIITMLCIVGNLITSSFSAFISSGYYKGVSFLSRYYFSSNILSGINSDADLSGVQYHVVSNTGTNNITVQIRNYDANMIPDTFRIVYKVKVWLSEAPSAGFSYSYSDANHTNALLTVAQQEFTGLEIAGDGALNSSEFTISFDRDVSADIADASKINIVVTPTLPTYMTNGYELGTQLTFVETTAEFDVTGSFDSTISNLSEYAGFLYNVSTSGSLPDNENCTVTLKWDDSMLEFDETSPIYLANTTTTVTEGGIVKKVISFGVDTGDSIKIAFYRKQGSSWTDKTKADLDTYVEFSSVTE